MRILRKLKRRAFEIDSIKELLIKSLEFNEKEKQNILNDQLGREESCNLLLDYKKYGLIKPSPKDFFSFSSDLLFSLNIIKRNSTVLEDGVSLKPSPTIYLRSQFFITKLLSFFINGQKVIHLKTNSLKEQLEKTRVNDDFCFNDMHTPLESFYFNMEYSPYADVYVDGCFLINTIKEIVFFIIVENTHNLNGTKEKEIDFIRISIPKNKNISNALKEAIEDYISNNKNSQLKELELYKEIMQYSLVMTINTLIYINTAKKSKHNLLVVEEDDKRINHKSNGRKIGKRIADANYNYILSNNSQKNKDIGEYIKNGRKIETQFIVSGHYRKQPIGSRDGNETKIVWIEPYIKGINYKQDDKLKITVV